MKCMACGSTALIEGTLGGEGSTIGFQPADTPLLKRMFAMGQRAVRAYGCIHCRHLQLAVDFDDSDFERYQQFEGQQPSVLERINSGPDELKET